MKSIVCINSKQIYIYLLCTFCIMDQRVNFTSKLKLKNVGVLKKIFKLVKLDPKLSDLVMAKLNIL